MSDKLGYTKKEACDFLGLRLTRLNQLMASGELPYRKLGRRVILLRPDLEKFLKSLRKGTGRGAA